MKLIIEIPEEVYEKQRYSQYFGAWSVVLQKCFENGTPLPKGHWTERTMHSNGFFLPNCSECGRMQPYAHHTYQPNFCPNCGADMRKAESEGKE